MAGKGEARVAIWEFEMGPSYQKHVAHPWEYPSIPHHLLLVISVRNFPFPIKFLLMEAPTKK